MTTPDEEFVWSPWYDTYAGWIPESDIQIGDYLQAIIVLPMFELPLIRDTLEGFVINMDSDSLRLSQDPPPIGRRWAMMAWRKRIVPNLEETEEEQERELEDT